MPIPAAPDPAIWLPTPELRWHVSMPGGTPVLQQAWASSGGASEWRDVATVSG